MKMTQRDTAEKITLTHKCILVNNKLSVIQNNTVTHTHSTMLLSIKTFSKQLITAQHS